MSIDEKWGDCVDSAYDAMYRAKRRLERSIRLRLYMDGVKFFILVVVPSYIDKYRTKFRRIFRMS
jgi:hypothetical protein